MTSALARLDLVVTKDGDRLEGVDAEQDATDIGVNLVGIKPRLEVVEDGGRVKDVQVNHVVQTLGSDRRVRAALRLWHRVAVRRGHFSATGGAHLRLAPGALELDVDFRTR